MVTTQWWSFFDSSKNVKVIEGGGTREVVVDEEEFGREGAREERVEEDELELELLRDKS